MDERKGSLVFEEIFFLGIYFVSCLILLWNIFIEGVLFFSEFSLIDILFVVGK